MYYLNVLAQYQEVGADVPAQNLDDIFKEREDIPARVSGAKERAPSGALSPEIDPGMWLNMVNVNTPYLADLELDSKKATLWLK